MVSLLRPRGLSYAIRLSLSSNNDANFLLEVSSSRLCPYPPTQQPPHAAYHAATDLAAIPRPWKWFLLDDGVYGHDTVGNITIIKLLTSLSLTMNLILDGNIWEEARKL